MTDINTNIKIADADKVDIIELDKRIKNYHLGKEDDDRFKLYRLTRGVYGQRQQGVQMFRIKIPYGKISPEQIRKVAELSEKYASSNLHLTTRQDIQLHYVKLDDSPKVWVGLTESGLTGREACGNTVRNLCASAEAGIDPEELFDVTPYAHEMAYYFLRNPISQEMGRKIKIAFSSSDVDSAYTYFHDFGFIPRVKVTDGKEQRGFKVYLGGGLGAVAMIAKVAFEFLPAEKIIPFVEASIRVFDRYGEREKRQKARMKFLIKSLGLEGFLALVEEEQHGIKQASLSIDTEAFEYAKPVKYFKPDLSLFRNTKKYNSWLKANVFEQKQKGFYGVYLKISLGDISALKAKALASIAEKYASEDIRITVNQGILLKFIHEGHLPVLFNALNEEGFAEIGFDSIGDITACPGTDTCNLGVTNSTGLSAKIEELIKTQFPDLLEEKHIRIKISGCMNACGQHMASNIGLHGSSIKREQLVIPAMQFVLGGGIDPDGTPRIGEKVIKLPTKKILFAVSCLLEDFDDNRLDGEYFNIYYRRQGKKYFYNLLKPYADITNLNPTDFFDWGQNNQYQQEIGVGECAGVILDLVGTIIKDAEEKIDKAHSILKQKGHPTDALYYAYSANVIGAKALLLSEDLKCNTQIKILDDFQTHFVDTGKFPFNGSFKSYVLKIKNEKANTALALAYIESSKDFINKVVKYRTDRLSKKQVVSNYYKA